MVRSLGQEVRVQRLLWKESQFFFPKKQENENLRRKEGRGKICVFSDGIKSSSWGRSAT